LTLSGVAIKSPAPGHFECYGDLSPTDVVAWAAVDGLDYETAQLKGKLAVATWLLGNNRSSRVSLCEYMKAR
jgi:hypothetical protein